jgi:hypothetical protein
MAPTANPNEGGLGVRGQIERYRTAFISVVVMIVIAAATGGYILAHENLKLPGWVPVLGRNFYTLKADFQTAQAVTPGQGQAVTIAGAKIGEIATVTLHQGVATVSMKITPKYARFYRNATLLLRPKTQLQDITVEVNPGTPDAGKLRSGEVIPQSQTAPNIDFDEFLAGLDADTRAYLQELLAGAGEGFKNNARAFSATLKRFAPTARYGQEIAQQLEIRHANIARSIHNFRLLMEALGGKDKQLAQLVDASNTTCSRRCTCSPAPSARPAARWGSSPRRHTSSARRSPNCGRSHARWPPPTKRRSVWRTRRRRSSATRSGRSPAKSCRSSRSSAPPPSSSAKRSRNSPSASRC